MEFQSSPLTTSTLLKRSSGTSRNSRSIRLCISARPSRSICAPEPPIMPVTNSPASIPSKNLILYSVSSGSTFFRYLSSVFDVTHLVVGIVSSLTGTYNGFFTGSPFSSNFGFPLSSTRNSSSLSMLRFRSMTGFSSPSFPLENVKPPMSLMKPFTVNPASHCFALMSHGVLNLSNSHISPMLFASCLPRSDSKYPVS